VARAPSAFSSAAAAAAAHQRLVQRGAGVVVTPPKKAPSILNVVRPVSPGGFVQMPTVAANSGVTVPRPVRAVAPSLQSFAQDLSIPGLDGLFAGLAESGEAAEE